MYGTKQLCSGSIPLCASCMSEYMGYSEKYSVVDIIATIFHAFLGLALLPGMIEDEGGGHGH